jgi:hypothetical protein
MWSGVWKKYEDFLHKMTLEKLQTPIVRVPGRKRVAGR